jgi:outer membrane lipoprotein SlyB
METLDRLRAAGASRRDNGILYPVMLIAAIAVIVFSIVGIATMTGVMPRALSSASEQSPPDRASSDEQHKATPAPATSPARPASARPAPQSGSGNRTRSPMPVACAECGVVESIRAVESAGQGSGVGAVAGGVLGGVLGNQVGGGRGRTAMTVVGAGAGAYAGHEIEKNMNKSVSYQIRVRMNDGTLRTVYDRTQPALTVGQKVRVTDNGIVTAG